ncbi:MAG: B12-binding domain-containing radical SAM protein [Syntrophales bacterium]
MKLVLAAIHIKASPRAVPLGSAMLAAVIRRTFGAEIQTGILNLYLDQPAVECADRILESDPDHVGFSMYVWNRSLSLEIAAILKQRRPGLVIFAGGAEATADQAGVLGDPAIDFVLPGEGEAIIVETLGRLLRGATTQEIAASARPIPVKDLATLPSPFLDGTLKLADYSGALWELSRGCPFTCDFCFESRGTAGIRRIPMNRVEAELELFAASGIREVFVLDPTFNYRKANAKRMLRLIAVKAPDIHFFFEIRSEFIDREMAGLFAAIRCSLQIGLQSAHDAVLRRVSRRFDPADFEAKILLLHNADVTYGFDLIYGLPGDSLEGFRASLDFAMSLVPNHIDIFSLSVLPGTRLAETASALNLEHEACNPYQVIASPTFSRKDIGLAARIAHGCDVLYNQGKAVPWFGIIMEALEISPSEVFERFAAWLESHPSEDLTQTQRDFIGSLFEESGNTLTGSIAADIISYFGYSAELMDARPMDSDRRDSPSRRVAFNHDPVDLLTQMQAGTISLEELVFSLPKKACDAVLSVNDGTIVINVLRVP